MRRSAQSVLPGSASRWIGGLLAALLALPALAQSQGTGTSAAASASAPAASSTASLASGWSYELTPYLWAPGLRTDVTLGPLAGSMLSVGSGSVLRAVDVAAMGSFEARKGPWGGFLDAVYADLSVDKRYAGGLLGGYNVGVTEQIYTLGASYRLVDADTKVDLMAGGRYTNIGSSLYIAPSPRGLGAYRSDTLASWAGIIGARAIVPVADRWSLMGYLDGGEGSGYSTWQVMAGAIYQYSPSTSVKFGYRLLNYSIDDPVLVDKVRSGGIYAGLGFKF